MKSPKISIVIPSFNKGKYIDRTLASIFDQSYRNFEVIIEDGGSTDETLSIIRKYVIRYQRQIYCDSKKDGGQLLAINTGLKLAVGDIVTFINADDEYCESAFESIVGYYKENPSALWFAGKAIVIDENDNEIAKFATLYKNFLLSLSSIHCLLITNYLMQPSVFLTKTALQKYKLFSGTKNFVMEYDMWLKIAKDRMPIIINKTLSKFRIEKDTKTSTLTKLLLAEDEKIVKKYTNNFIILFLHKIHNLARVISLKLV